MVTQSQIRAARGLLDWTQQILADKAGMTRATIKNIEKGQTSPSEAALGKIRKAFEDHGIEFTPGDGVKRRNATLTVLEGDEANNTLLDDIYESLTAQGGEILIAGLKEIEDRAGPAYQKLIDHLARLEKINVSEKLLIQEGDKNFVAPKEWYRWLPKEYFSPGTFQLYGDKLAMIQWGPPQQVIIIENSLIAESFRKLFHFAWDNSKVPGDDQ